MTQDSKLTVGEAFCDECGSLLPMLSNKDIPCYYCKKQIQQAMFKDSSVKYVIHFNAVVEDESSSRNIGEDEAEGPVVDRKCPRCNNEKMAYATLQLRSADEGQTVFFTCTRCKFKETENS